MPRHYTTRLHKVQFNYHYILLKKLKKLFTNSYNCEIIYNIHKICYEYDYFWKGLIIMPELESTPEMALVTGCTPYARELKPYRINEKSTDDKNSEISLTEQGNRMEISNFNKPKAPHHVRRYKMFKEVINAFNQRLGVFKALEIVPDITEINNFLEQKGVENNEINFWNVKITKKIELFGKTKNEFTKSINEAKSNVEKAKTAVKDAKILEKIKLKKELKKAEQTLKNSEKILKQFEFVRKSIKFDALYDNDIATLKTFLHTVINKNKGDDHSKSTGMEGTLFKVNNFIRDKINENKWKHTSTSEFKDILADMQTKSKGFDKSVEKFGRIKEEYKKMMERNGKQQSDSEKTEKFDAGELQIAIKALEVEIGKNVEIYIKQLTDGIKNKTIKNTEDVKTWGKKFSKKINEIREKFIKKMGYEGNKDLENRVITYTDIYCGTEGMISPLRINYMEERVKICDNNSIKEIFSFLGTGFAFSLGGLLCVTAVACPFAAMICGAVAVALTVDALASLVAYFFKVKNVEKIHLKGLKDCAENGEEIRKKFDEAQQTDT